MYSQGRVGEHLRGYSGPKQLCVVVVFVTDIVGRWGPMAALYADPGLRPMSNLVYLIPVLEGLYWWTKKHTYNSWLDYLGLLIVEWLPQMIMNIQGHARETVGRGIAGMGIMCYLFTLEKSQNITYVYYFIFACLLTSNIGWIFVIGNFNKRRRRKRKSVATAGRLTRLNLAKSGGGADSSPPIGKMDTIQMTDTIKSALRNNLPQGVEMKVDERPKTEV